MFRETGFQPNPPADAVVALEGAKLTRYSTLALPRTLHRADYEMGILGIGIAALISVDIDVLGHCPPPSGSYRFFAEEKYIAASQDDMTRIEGAKPVLGRGPKGTSRKPGWFRRGRAAPRRHDRRKGPHGHSSCMPRNRQPPVSRADMRAGARGRRAGDSHAGGSDHGEMAEWATDFPQPSHGCFGSVRTAQGCGQIVGPNDVLCRNLHMY